MQALQTKIPLLAQGENQLHIDTFKDVDMNSISEKLGNVKRVLLANITDNQRTALHDQISQLLDEGHTITFKPGVPYELDGELYHPAEIIVLWQGETVSRAKSTILDDAMSDVFTSTPERAARGEGE